MSIPADATREPAAVRPWYLNATRLAALPWLIRLRVATAVIDLVAVLAVLLLPNADIPLRHAVVFIALSGTANAALALALSRQRSLPAAAVGVSLLLDVALLTELLDLTGGPFNPFAVVYVAHIALAAATAGRGTAWLVGLAATSAYATLLYWHTLEGVSVHHRINDFPTHLFTMWVSLGAMVELAAYFAVQASNALEAMRERAARSERVISLTTLAAGAAHELSTPLATIAITAREMERAVSQLAERDDLADDARLIRTEVDRCRHILDQMSGRAGGGAAELPEPLDVRAILDEVQQALPTEQRARVRVEAGTPLPRVHAPRAAFRQTISSLLSNAIDASAAPAPVVVTAEEVAVPRAVRVVVRDRGPGMTPDLLARAGEPFFTTKDAGRGLGLGLFLARVFAERCGGSLTIDSTAGTAVALELPVSGGDAPA
ncbi:MAG: ATP-binding protein [Acidobacteriota bacterium]